ncbi:hypothetical protein EH223_11525 [candidate division KSB1 bacterium]|nr:hypothetical protein [candidate division KSB1 bacterium]RQW02839.1 MAG: hypothetical protein EH223_11525 [candidate division KSB1 bacterium]
MSIQDLYLKLKNTIVDNTLEMSAQTTGLADFDTFLYQSFNVSSVTLHDPKLDNSQNDKLVVEGKTSLLGVQNVSVTFSFMAKSDQIVFSMEADFRGQQISIGVYAIDDAIITMQWCDDEAGTYSAVGNLEGKIKFDVTIVDISQPVAAIQDGWIISADFTHKPVPVASLAELEKAILINDLTLLNFFPPTFFNATSLMLNDIKLTCKPVAVEKVERIDFHLAATTWTIVNQYLTIHNLSFSISLDFPFVATKRHITGSIEAILRTNDAVDIQVQMQKAENEWHVTSVDTSVALISFRFAESLNVYKSSALVNHLPHTFSEPVDITLSSLHFRLDDTAEHLLEHSSQINLDWRITPYLTLYETSFAIAINFSNGLSAPEFALGATGRLRIGLVDFMALVEKKQSTWRISLVLEGETANFQLTDISSLLSNQDMDILAPPGVTSDFGVGFEAFAIEFGEENSHKTITFDFALGVATEWVFPISDKNIIVHAVLFAFSHTRQKQNSNWTSSTQITLKGEFSIGSISGIVLSAERKLDEIDKQNFVWIFAFGLGEKQIVTMADFAETLLPSTVKFPKELDNCSLIGNFEAIPARRDYSLLNGSVTIGNCTFESSFKILSNELESFNGSITFENNKAPTLLNFVNAILPNAQQLPTNLVDFRFNALAFSYSKDPFCIKFSGSLQLLFGSFDPSLIFQFTASPETGALNFVAICKLEEEETLSLFGVHVILPEALSLVCAVDRPSRTEDSTMSLALEWGRTVNGQGENVFRQLSVATAFSMAREIAGEVVRDVQNTDQQCSDEILRLSFTPDIAADALKITLLEVKFGEKRKVSYFPETSDIAFDVELAINIPADIDFRLPFLEGSGTSQALSLATPLSNIYGKLDLSNPIKMLQFNLPLILTLHDNSIATVIPVEFDLTNLAVKIDHEKGLPLLSSNKSFTAGIMGMNWIFEGAEFELGDETLYHYFTLATNKFNYQLLQAPGSELRLEFTQLGKEPLAFYTRDFRLTSKGVSLTAEVSDEPVTLNSIETKFRFGGTTLLIEENRILDFTLKGSGSLPPALVGNAIVDAELQFSSVKNKLRLVNGGAKLRGGKLLDCKGTRFQFVIDGLGLKFIYDRKFHLYFTLSGKARFVPAPDDDKDGPLAKLPEIELELVDVPLTGNPKVLKKYINFLIQFPKPLTFSFLGIYNFELRAIGFDPVSEKFDGRPAMMLSGQVRFAHSAGDIIDPKPDLHMLYIGLPPKGSSKPEVGMGALSVGIKSGKKFKLGGTVKFEFSSTMQGFKGDGVVEIKGLPPMAASFGFLRIRRSPSADWDIAWFIYIEARKVSYQIPVVNFYIREVGLGFGYRFTLVALKEADASESLSEMIGTLREISRTQGDLSKFDRWAVDYEKENEDPRWTIVLRAMLSQMSASKSPLRYDEKAEKVLPNTYLFDVLIAIRSDLTFFMAVRGWLNTNYDVYFQKRSQGKPIEPFLSGFAFLWPNEKRFLAHVASNPNGYIGNNPPLPDFLKGAMSHVQFSATLLVEPGLMHLELGWPNNLRWKEEYKVGPVWIRREIRGGCIFRMSETETVIGLSFLARVDMKVDASINLGLVGATLKLDAHAAFGGRIIGLIPYKDSTPVLYAAVGLDVLVRVLIILWIKIPLLFFTLKLSFSFRFQLGFSAALELGYQSNDLGLRGHGTAYVSLMGHRLSFNVHLSYNSNIVDRAYSATKGYLNIGLEAADVDKLPGGLN